MMRLNFCIGMLKFLVILLFLPMFQAFTTQVDTVLSQIPQEDKEFLNRQLKSLLTTELGYTLLGAKPVSITEFVDSEICNNIHKQTKLRRYIKKIFDKSSSFVCVCPKNGEYDFDVGLINIKAVKRVFEKEILYFQQSGEFRSADEIIFRAQDRRKKFYNWLGKDPISHGILFGYGKSNAELFVRRCQIGDHLCRCPLVWIAPMPAADLETPLIQKWLLQIRRIEVPYALQSLEPRSPFKSLEEEWDRICAVTAPYHEAIDPPYLMYFPQFISKKSDETDSIMHAFSETRNQFGEIFSKGNYLEEFLKIIYE